MGHLENGVWKRGWYEPNEKGAFERPETKFRNHVEHGVPGRYLVYASYACPWAHRSLITRALRGLDRAIDVCIVDPKMSDEGWSFAAERPDPVLGATYLRELYLRADPHYTGRVTVPVLWDRELGTIVNNESREVMRMLDTAFEACAERKESLAPLSLRTQIDDVLTAIYEPINNGVYRAGFATKQGAYEEACHTLFEHLDRWENVLGKQRYLCGERLTEADVAMFTTLLRFDLVYYAHFKCNVRRIEDYPALWGYLRDIYQTEGVKETCHLDHIKTHYYWSQTTVNPHRIVPVGPTLDLDTPHGRG